MLDLDKLVETYFGRTTGDFVCFNINLICYSEAWRINDIICFNPFDYPTPLYCQLFCSITGKLLLLLWI